MTSPLKPSVRTKAWITFERNLDMIGHLVDLGSREATTAHASLAKFAKAFNPAKQLSEGKDVAKVAVKIAASVSRVVSEYQTRIDKLGTATQWQVVILVTCIEAYLQDILEAAASADPELMSNSKQGALYQEVIAAASLDELASELRQRWARRWLSDGGPSRWISCLEKMGARGYSAGLAPQLELIWGIRHILVHSAGTATADFLRRHPGAAKATGERVRVSTSEFSAFLKTTSEFLDPTERFFLARYPALRVVPVSSESKR